MVILLWGITTSLSAQRITRYQTEEMELIYFGDRYSYIMPHVAGTFHNASRFHEQHWDYDHSMTHVLLTDFEDDGHGGAMVTPHNMIVLGISPFNFAFSITPSYERFQWLFSHEFTHITMADKPNKTDRFWRSALMGKIRRNDKAPVSAAWSYLTTPRWYAPRWYHEGIATYMETWLSGGIGRSLSPYDEMYFRSIIHEDKALYSVVGLETEGTTIDFQVGANAYLYGTRFITYLGATYGDEKVKAFYKRSDSSKAFYATQFRKVFEKSIHEAWREWIVFEKSFQKENLERIREYPITPFRPLTEGPEGSFSTIGYDAESQKVYAAINHPGKLAFIGELDLATGNIRQVAPLDSPMLYTVAYLAYDPENDVIFLSENNNKYRSLVRIDVKSGKKETLIDLSRTGNLAFNQKDRSLWGVQHDNGYARLVKIPPPYDEIIPMHTTAFGQSLLDLAVSNDGRKISATLTGVRGEQSLILFDADSLEQGDKTYKTLYKSEDNTLTQFRFSDDDRYLIGTSYYTGVSNIWRLSLEDDSFELLSNAETGFFVPQQVSEDSLFVLKFRRDGMQPGIIPMQVLQDANAINYLGNEVVEKSPQVINYSLPSASKQYSPSEKTEEAPYFPVRNMAFSNAFPDIAGYKDDIVVGYRMNWSDRTSLSKINLFVAASPWSSYPGDQQFHGHLQWDYWNWHLDIAYNKTDFYDLFGPTKRSRAGYSIGINHQRKHTLKAPFEWHYGFGATHYGDLEVLPQFQNISAPLRSFQSMSASISLSKLKKSLGAVEKEQGYQWTMDAYSYLANGTLYPSLVSSQDIGWLVPGIRNTSLWIRNSLGQAFGESGSAFSNFYLGGFRNNYVDWQAASQYRKIFAFPGAEIDELAAQNFVKTMGELNLKPLRLRRVGTTWLYPTFIKPALFGTHLLLNPDNSAARRNVFNMGAQIDVELVLFSYLKTTWSAGYARKMEATGLDSDQWMFSVKLLGN